MKISEIISVLERLAPTVLQESYDNAGLLTGDASWECRAVICTLDCTEEIVEEAIKKNCNLIVAHHPIIFGGLKKITGRNYVEKTIIKAIKNDIAIYAIHTNLDNIITGVNSKIADKLGLTNRKILSNKSSTIKKLFTFVPVEHINVVRDAIFNAGGGHIGNYSEASFSVEGLGTFKGGEGTNPFVGKPGQRHEERELKVEIIFPSWLQDKILSALIKSHPYEEVAYDMVSLDNTHQEIGAGIFGDLANPMKEQDFLTMLKRQFGLKIVRHTRLLQKEVRKVAVCGGAGSFLVTKALAAGAQAYVTADMKYHEFFDANDRMLICDIGHYESEQFTIDLLAEHLQQKFPTFAVLKPDHTTNPVYYF
jgi:dinuclear metal center YbgI/SA1388 family protein